jgi:hypothetical protein
VLSNAIVRLTELLAVLRLMLLGILLLLLRLRLLQKVGRALAIDETGDVTGHGHFGGDFVKHLAQLGARLAAEKAAAEAPKAARLRLGIGARRLTVRSLLLLLLLDRMFLPQSTQSSAGPGHEARRDTGWLLHAASTVDTAVADAAAAANAAVPEESPSTEAPGFADMDWEGTAVAAVAGGEEDIPRKA